MQLIDTSKQIKDPFLVKEIVEFLYHKNYSRIGKKLVSNPITKIGTPYRNFEQIIKTLDPDKDYVLISDFLQLSKRGVKNKAYMLNYKETVTWIGKIDSYFEGPFSLLAIDKSNPDSFSKSHLIFYIIEEGVFFQIDVLDS